MKRLSHCYDSRAASFAAIVLTAAITIRCGLTESDDEDQGKPDSDANGGAAGSSTAGAAGIQAAGAAGSSAAGGTGTAGSSSGTGGTPAGICTGECIPIGLRCALGGVECSCSSDHRQDCPELSGASWPLYPPIAGAACAEALEGMVCDQPALGDCSPSCTCIDGSWVCEPTRDGCPGFACPIEAPEPGSACSPLKGQHCSFGDRRCIEIECSCEVDGTGDASWTCLGCYRPC